MYGVTLTPVSTGGPGLPSGSQRRFAARFRTASARRSHPKPRSAADPTRCVVIGVRFDSPDRLRHVRRHAGDRRQRGARCDRATPSTASIPPSWSRFTHIFDGRQHADGFFLPDLHRAPGPMMRRAVHPRGANEILAPEQQPRRLRTTQTFAAAVCHQRGAALQMHVGNRENLGGRIDDNRHPFRVRHLRDRFEVEHALIGARAPPARRSSPSAGRAPPRAQSTELDLDDACADGAHGRVVHVPRMASG